MKKVKHNPEELKDGRAKEVYYKERERFEERLKSTSVESVIEHLKRRKKSLHSNFAGFFCPIGILHDWRLTPCEKLILSYILSFWRCGDGFWATNMHLKVHLGISKATVSKAIKKFLELGYIQPPGYFEDCRIVIGTPELAEIYFDAKKMMIHNT